MLAAQTLQQMLHTAIAHIIRGNDIVTVGDDEDDDDDHYYDR